MFGKKDKKLTKVELNEIHQILTDIFNGKRKYTTTKRDDILYLRTRIREILNKRR